MVYQKNFPHKREPFFWAILSSHLAAGISSATESERNLYKTLAHRFLSKAVTDAIEIGKIQDGAKPDSKSISKAIRAVQSSDDLRLLVVICRYQGKYREALAVLDDPIIGLSSKLGGKSWDLAREKIELLELCELWQELWQLCKHLLLDARSDNLKTAERAPHMGFGAFGNDWKVWKGLVVASAKMRNRESVVPVFQYIQQELTLVGTQILPRP